MFSLFVVGIMQLKYVSGFCTRQNNVPGIKIISKKSSGIENAKGTILYKYVVVNWFLARI